MQQNTTVHQLGQLIYNVCSFEAFAIIYWREEHWALMQITTSKDKLAMVKLQ